MMWKISDGDRMGDFRKICEWMQRHQNFKVNYACAIFPFKNILYI